MSKKNIRGLTVYEYRVEYALPLILLTPGNLICWGLVIMQHPVIPMDQFPSQIALPASKDKSSGTKAAVLSFEELAAFSLRSHTMESPVL